MKASEVCNAAAAIVQGDRERTHGDKEQNHACIAAVWNGILEARRIGGKSEKLDALDVANLMEGLKIARRYSGAHNDDDYIDGAGYAAVAGEIATQ